MASCKRNDTKLFLAAFYLFLLIPEPTFPQIKIMPLGDSITEGVSGPSSDDAGYRNDLADSLLAEGVDVDFVGSRSNGVGFDSDHEGWGGKKADYILENINSFLTAQHPDIVLLHVGTNDISSGETPESTRDEIGAILEAIATFNADIKIILTSLIPRTDDKDETTTNLNTLIEELFFLKRGEGLQVFYAGINEIFKCNPNWATNYFELPDHVHPNDAGFNVMANTWLNAIMTAINIGPDITVTDNFDRRFPGITWDHDPEIQIRNGELVNTARQGQSTWEFMATFKALKNPTHVAIRWSADADEDGIGRGGLALLLDTPSKDASGYLAWITPDDNFLHLWTIENGTAGQDLNQSKESATNAPGPGDLFRVDLSGDVDSLYFDYYVNDSFAGQIAISDPDLNGELYSGVLLRHRRNNDIAEFFADGSGDFVPPSKIDNLSVSHFSATSATLTWTATGDDGMDGKAASYDLRYSTEEIVDNNDFASATPGEGLPTPAAVGVPELFAEVNLQPNTTYYFALKVVDEAGNESPMSNVVSITTKEGELFTDDFNRTELGADWVAASSMQIMDNELANPSTDQGIWDLAVFAAKANPAEVSFKWSPNADSIGIDQGGLAVMLDAPTTSANGYLITRRTLENQLRLWKIVAGQNPSEPIRVTPLLARPQPGQEFRIVISSDSSGNQFTVFINGQQDTTLTDSTFFMDPESVSDFYAGVMLDGGRNNNVDDFKVLLSDNAVSVDQPDYTTPKKFVLSQNYPNPFNPQTRLDYQLPVAGHVQLTIYNLKGQSIRTLFEGWQPAGLHTISWNGTTATGLAAASGVYFVRMQAGEFVAVRRILLAK